MQVDGNVSDCHLLQLRFGYMHYPRIYCSLDLLVLANFIKATGLDLQFSNACRISHKSYSSCRMLVLRMLSIWYF